MQRWRDFENLICGENVENFVRVMTLLSAKLS